MMTKTGVRGWNRNKSIRNENRMIKTEIRGRNRNK